VWTGWEDGGSHTRGPGANQDWLAALRV